ncbi:MAG: DUF5711 family protein [Candidatus Altiarchaeota archaeon]
MWKNSIILLALIAIACSSVDIPLMWSNKFKEEILCLKQNENFIVVCFSEKISFFSKRGQNLWNYTLEDEEIKKVAIYDNKILVATTRNIYLLSDGVLQWKKEIDSWVGYENSIHLSKDKIIIGLMNGELYLFDIEGNEIFKRKLDAYIITVSEFENNIIAVSDKGIYLFDENGNLRIMHRPKSYIRTATIYAQWVVLSLGNDALEFYTVNKGLEFSSKLNETIGAIAISDRKIIAGSKKGNLYLFEFNGNLKWKKNLKSSITLVAFANDNIFALTIDNKIFIMDEKGKISWSYETNEKISSFSAIGQHIVIGTNEGMLYFFNLERNPETGIFIFAVMLSVLLLFMVMFYIATK